jgi:hypothetical protein
VDVVFYVMMDDQRKKNRNQTLISTDMHTLSSYNKHHISFFHVASIRTKSAGWITLAANDEPPGKLASEWPGFLPRFGSRIAMYVTWLDPIMHK